MTEGLNDDATEKQVNFEPFHDRVLVLQDEDAEAVALKGGIVLPDNQKERPLEGRVMAVGPGRYELGVFIPLECVVGDQVLFGKYAGTEMTVDGVEYKLMRDEETFGRRLKMKWYDDPENKAKALTVLVPGSKPAEDAGGHGD